MKQTAYLLGRLCAQREKRAGLRDTAATWWDLVSGKAIRRVLAQEREKVLQKTPYVAKRLRKYAPYSGAIEGYVTRVLKNSKNRDLLPAVDELRSRAHDAYRALYHGQTAVQAARRATLKARLGTAGATAAVAVPTTALLASKTSADTSESSIPALAGIGAGLAPTAQGVASGALRILPSRAPTVEDVVKLRELLQPGDILLTGEPGRGQFKPYITAIGGHPSGYHVEAVHALPTDTRYRVGITHATPQRGGAWGENATLGEGSEAGKDIIVKRFKNPEHARAFLDALKKERKAGRALQKTFGERARFSMYDKPASVRAGLLSFLPRPLQNLLTPETAICGTNFCSTLPAAASPVPLARNLRTRGVLPHHIETSPELETVARYFSPRTGAQRAWNALHYVAPWAVRGLLGAGLGYGTYKGLQALLK